MQTIEKFSNKDEGTYRRTDEDSFPSQKNFRRSIETGQHEKHHGEKQEVSNFTPTEGWVWREPPYDNLHSRPDQPEP
jgi:hypothetical protein